jgi:drug/metabolite transporter (DMT)-like permease
LPSRGIGGLLITPFFGAFQPLPRTCGWLALGSAMTLVAIFSITSAMRVGDVSAVTPFRYTRLVFALVIALLVFGERPDAWTLIGAAIVVASGLYTFWREAQRARLVASRPRQQTRDVPAPRRTPIFNSRNGGSGAS